MVSSPLVRISEELRDATEQLSFAAPVAYTYNPLVYAWRSHEAYLTRYGRGAKEVLLVGMNPGPFGMAQTGVPFGDVSMVRDWMGLSALIGKPSREHPKRLVQGFACTRSEVSGTRLWGFARDRFGAPEQFFERFLVINYCPLCFMEASGKNFTPDKLPSAEKKQLFEVCDVALARIIEATKARFVVGVGAFAETRVIAARERCGNATQKRVTVGSILHPSPASPKANRGWAAEAARELAELGVTL